MLRKIFWLTSQREPYRIHIRLQVRVACLGGFLDLCQSVKNKFFDRLNRLVAICNKPVFLQKKSAAFEKSADFSFYFKTFR